MKILFAANRTWDDQPSVWAILDEIAGNEPVHLVLGFETRGAEFYAAEWAKQRAKLRRTFVDVIRAGKSFGDSVSERRPRRDAYMVDLGGYDVAVILSRPVRSGHATSARPLEVARLAEKAGIPVDIREYKQEVSRFNHRREGSAQ